MIIELSDDEALVLFDWVARTEGRPPYEVEHGAEQHVLWHIEAQLERALVEPFQKNYGDLVARARERIIAACGEIEPR
jgi:hypothetical protein